MTLTQVNVTMYLIKCEVGGNINSQKYLFMLKFQICIPAELTKTLDQSCLNSSNVTERNVRANKL